jgi:hypothetical protein
VRNSPLAEIHPLNFPPENYPVVKFWVNFERVNCSEGNALVVNASKVNFQQGAVVVVQSSTSREVVAQQIQGDSLSPVHPELVLAHAGSELAEMGVFWSE